MKHTRETYDVLVAGGGLAGVSAAISSARHGATTCLVQDRPVLGGNSSSEVRVTPHGAAAFHAYARETGIVSEALIEERAKNHEKITENGWTNSVWDLTLYDMAMRTNGLTLMLNTSIESVVKDDNGGISSVTARIANAESIVEIHAGSYIDCTGDGTMAAMAGNSWVTGAESHSELGEPHAPESPTDDVMGSSLHFKTVDTGAPIEYHAPAWAVKYEDDSFFYKGGRIPKTLDSGYWWIELGPPFDTIEDNETIRHELTRHVLGIWDYLKNRDPNWSKKAETIALDWVGQVPGKRESRRLSGKRFVNENELLERTKFKDEVAFGGWYVDLHTLGGLLAETSEPLNAKQLDPTSQYGASTNIGPFGIPLGIMMSDEIPNLMMAGRNVSASHAAMGSIRVMSTCALMGQATGTVAATAATTGNTLHYVSEHLMDRIQQTLLRDGAFLPNVKNADGNDLARYAKAYSSSEDEVRGIGPSSADWLNKMGQWTDHPVFPATGKLQHRSAQWIALGDSQDLQTIELCLSSLDGNDQGVDLQIHAVRDIWDYRVDADEPLASTTLNVQSSSRNWIAWRIGDEIDSSVLPKNGYIRVSASPNQEVEWHIGGTVQPGNVAAYEASPGLYRRYGGGTTLSFKVDPPQRSYPSENAINGVTRPHEFTNMWRSNPLEPLPQYIGLNWDESQTIREVQITFSGHLLREYHAYPPKYRDSQTARNYSIQARNQNGEWATVLVVQDNYSTRNVHNFNSPITTDAIRLLISETNGDPSASVYEIRCYQHPSCTIPSFNPLATTA